MLSIDILSRAAVQWKDNHAPFYFCFESSGGQLECCYQSIRCSIEGEAEEHWRLCGQIIVND